jgi:tetratricopeptide (TPR) repeat protein
LSLPSNKHDAKKTAGVQISLALGVIALGLVGMIAYQLFRVPVSENGEPGEGSRSALNDRSGTAARLEIKAEMNLKPSPDLLPQKLSEGDEKAAGVKQAGMEENQTAVEEFQAGRYEAAAALLGKAHDLDPTNSVYTKNLAYAKARIAWNLINREEYGAAETGFHSAIALYPEEFSFYVGLGVACHRQKKAPQAKKAADKALHLGPNNSAPYKLLGEIAYQEDQLEEALGYFQKAVQLGSSDPNLPSIINKLQREHRVQGRFQQEATIHFTVKFEGHEERRIADEVVRVLEEAYGEIGRSFSYYPDRSITVILYSDQQFRDITRTPAWAGGFFDGKIRVPTEGAGSHTEALNRVLYHEFTHAIVHALTEGHVPTWLNEGLALNFEREAPPSPSSSGSTQWDSPISGAIRANGLLSLDALHGSFLEMDQPTAQLAYAESYSAVKYLIDRYGMFAIQALLKDLSRQRDFSKAFEDRFFVSYREFQTEWQKGLSQ